jgi:hypothetical protein
MTRTKSRGRKYFDTADGTAVVSKGSECRRCLPTMRSGRVAFGRNVSRATLAFLGRGAAFGMPWFGIGD